VPDVDAVPNTGQEAGPDEGTVASGASEQTNRGRHHLLLPVIAAIVMVLGLAVAIAGVVTRANANSRAQAAKEELPVATQARTTAQSERDSAANNARKASADLADASTEAQRVLDIANTAAAIGDELTGFDQQIIDTSKAIVAAVAAQNRAQLQAAINNANAAINGANEALDRYDAATSGL